MSISKQLKQIIDEILCDECGGTEEEIDEISTTASTPGYQTPNAFSDDTDESKSKQRKNSTNSTGYKIVGEIYDQNYKSFKSDETKNSKQKVNGAIKEINKRLFEIERIINRTNKLKQEAGVTNTTYWKSTGPRINKIAERLLTVSRKLREIAG